MKWLDKQTQIRRLMQLSDKRKRNYNPSLPYWKNDNFRKREDKFNLQATAPEEIASNCEICNQVHDGLLQCRIFTLLSCNEKWNAVKSKGLCYICLSTGHRRMACTSEKCKLCGGPHNTTLHNPRQLPTYNNTPIANRKINITNVNTDVTK